MEGSGQERQSFRGCGLTPCKVRISQEACCYWIWVLASLPTSKSHNFKTEVPTAESEETFIETDGKINHRFGATE